MFAGIKAVENNCPKVDEELIIGGNFGVIFKVLSTSTGGSASIVEHTLGPKALGAPPHKHSHEDEISYILEGQVAVLQGNDLTIAGPGSYVVKPRGIFHAFWNAGTEPARLIEVIAPGGFENYFRELAPLILANAPPDAGSIIALAQRYGLEYAMDRIPELVQRYGLNMG